MENFSSFPLYSCSACGFVEGNLERLTGRSGEGTMVKEVRRISMFNYNFTKLKQIGFRGKKPENMLLPLIKISKQ